jgi:hypothetical protein
MISLLKLINEAHVPPTNFLVGLMVNSSLLPNYLQNGSRLGIKRDINLVIIVDISPRSPLAS